MSGLMHRRSDCRLCGGHDLIRVLSLTPTPPANAFVTAAESDKEQQCFPLDLYFCQACTHIQLLDVVNPELLFSEYVYVSGTSASFVAHLDNYAQTLVARFGLSSQDLIVDIGSNDGTLLAAFKKGGLQVLGVDPAHRLAEEATRRGLETLPEFFTSEVARRVRETYGAARVVTANNVFAHADDLAEILRGVRILLRNDGIFVFEVSYLLDVLQKTLFDTIYHEHLSYHSVAPLARFFAANGFELFSVTRIPTHGGSIRGYAKIAGAQYKPDGSVESLRRLEHKNGLDDPESFSDFSARITARKAELREVLIGIRARGKKIVGFGAPAKATTLMYHFDLGPMLSYIIDDNPLKQGLYSPGFHIPVFPSSRLYEESDPPYVLILAWNFADTIMQNHASLSKAGGHFIVPLPTVQVS